VSDVTTNTKSTKLVNVSSRVKRVRVTLEVDLEFVRLLQACLQLKTLLHEDAPRMTPADVLAVVALGECRGMTEAQIHARTPVEWRPHLEAVHAERRWQDEAGAWHATGGGST
jgi:hypothetical protein